MLSKNIVFIIFFTIVLLSGGCGERGGEKSKKPGSKNPLEEYASTLLHSLDKAKRAQLKASLPTIRLKINQFKQERGRYPDSLDELNISDLPLHALRYNPETGEVGLAQ
ncbi:MAG: hypothetical protein AMJ42_02120 [Deltaproteobacteria bacterium DG_8]|nr:MAG: hypothetical protein AMJ42_02120 [Deltaproteobacteria bacterium DG_8]